mgnify:CR=1 FL=1
MPAPELPGPLRATLTELVGPTPQWHRLTHATNAVWRADRIILKTLRSDRPYRQEHRAYTVWRPHLPEQTPTLLAADAATRTLVLTHVPGDPPLGLSAPAECTAHWHAGQFLKILHAVPDPDPDPLPLADALLKRHTAWLTRVSRHLDPDERTALTDLAAELPDLFAAATRVPTHRDFTPRNWLVRGPHGHVRELSVLDFEHARHDTPLTDFIKIAAELWPTRPDLEVSLLAGYGRDLTLQERRQLKHLIAIHAMATLAWAHDHRDPTFLAAGRTALATALA